MPSEYLSRIKPYLNNIKPLEPICTSVKPSIRNNSSIKCIVFDIYGTLIISASGDLDKSNVTKEGISIALKEAGFDWYKADNNVAADKLLQLFHHTVQEHQKVLRQKGHPYPEVDIIKVWEDVTKTANNNKWIKVLKTPNLYLLTVVFELLSNAVWPMPNMRSTLQKLFTSDLPIGIVSNAQFYTPIIMNFFMYNKVDDMEQIAGFDSDISVFSYKLFRSKPDTYLFENLAKSLKTKHNLQPHEVLFVGNDMLKDVWTASQLGFKTALFAADKRSLKLREDDERVKTVKADYIITELNQLFDIVSI